MTYQIRGESDKSSSMLLSVRLNFSLSLKVFKVLIVMKVGMVSKDYLKEKRCFKPILVFLAVQDSSIGDIVTHSLTHSVTLFDF